MLISPHSYRDSTMFGLKGMGWMTHYDRNPCNLIMALIEHQVFRTDWCDSRPSLWFSCHYGSPRKKVVNRGNGKPEKMEVLMGKSRINGCCFIATFDYGRVYTIHITVQYIYIYMCVCVCDTLYIYIYIYIYHYIHIYIYIQIEGESLSNAVGICKRCEMKMQQQNPCRPSTYVNRM